MSARSKIFRRVARAFAQPRGLSGSAAGWIMGHRYSNVRRSRWVVDLLDVQPTDHVLEIGFGPGVAIAELAERVTAGRVVGVDSSPVMLRQARRRNAAAIAAGLVRLHMAPVEDLPEDLGGPFDKLLAVNTVGIWHDPAARLADLAGRMRHGDRVAAVSQPRCPGATAEKTIAAGRELAGYLRGRLQRPPLRDPRPAATGGLRSRDELMERKWWTLLTTCVAMFMLLLEVTIVNVALPDTQRDLGSSFSELEWAVEA